MATGFMQRWKGKVMAQALWLGSGGIVDAGTGIAGKAQAAQRLSLPVTAVANTDFALSLPPGASVQGITIYTTTAYTGTTVTVQAGSSAGASDYVAAVSIKALGVVAATLAGQALGLLPAAPNMFVRVAQTGATAVGAATLVIDYVLP